MNLAAIGKQSFTEINIIKVNKKEKSITNDLWKPQTPGFFSSKYDNIKIYSLRNKWHLKVKNLLISGEGDDEIKLFNKSWLLWKTVQK